MAAACMGEGAGVTGNGTGNVAACVTGGGGMGGMGVTAARVTGLGS
jgi:hypothetical protein